MWEEQQRRIDEERQYLEQQRLAQAQRQMADVQAMQKQIQMQNLLQGLPPAMPGPGGVPMMTMQPGQVPFPQLQSLAGTQMALGGMGQQMYPAPYTLGPGAQRFTGTGVPMGEPVPHKPPTPRALTTFEQEQAEINRLSAIPKEQRTTTEQARLNQLLGRKKPAGKRQIVEVSPGEYKAQLIDPATGNVIKDFGKPTPKEMIGDVAPEALSKPVKAQLEKEIAMIDKSILESETVLSLWKPKFSTLGAQLEAWWTRKREKVKGIPIVGKAVKALIPVTAEEKRSLAEYSKWRGAAGKKFFAFRKWVTGVAGGQLEMDQIRQVFPDEKMKSPTEFAAMYEQMIAFEKAYKRQLIEAIRRGTIITDKAKADIIVDVFSTQAQIQQEGVSPAAGMNTNAVYDKFKF
jgi:hypothetical protein